MAKYIVRELKSEDFDTVLYAVVDEQYPRTVVVTYRYQDIAQEVADKMTSDPRTEEGYLKK